MFEAEPGCAQAAAVTAEYRRRRDQRDTAGASIRPTASSHPDPRHAVAASVAEQSDRTTVPIGAIPVGGLLGAMRPYGDQLGTGDALSWGGVDTPTTVLRSHLTLLAILAAGRWSRSSGAPLVDDERLGSAHWCPRARSPRPPLARAPSRVPARRRESVAGKHLVEPKVPPGNGRTLHEAPFPPRGLRRSTSGRPVRTVRAQARSLCHWRCTPGGRPVEPRPRRGTKRTETRPETVIHGRFRSTLRPRLHTTPTTSDPLGRCGPVRPVRAGRCVRPVRLRPVRLRPVRAAGAAAGDLACHDRLPAHLSRQNHTWRPLQLPRRRKMARYAPECTPSRR